MLPLPYCNNHVNLLYMYPGNLGGWSEVGGTIIDETGTTATCGFNHNTEYTLLQVHTYKTSLTSGMQCITGMNGAWHTNVIGNMS